MIYRRRTGECRHRWYKRTNQEGRNCSETHDRYEKMYIVMDDASNEKNNENKILKGEEFKVKRWEVEKSPEREEPCLGKA